MEICEPVLLDDFSKFKPDFVSYLHVQGKVRSSKLHPKKDFRIDPD